MFKNFKPLHDRVLVERIKGEEKTSGGIIIPSAAQEKGQTGKVLAIGTGRVDHNGAVHPLQVKVGDTVYFGKYSGTEIDDAQVILREDEILGIVG